MVFDARFELPDDVVHRVVEILQLCFLAMATQHIRPVEVMAHGGPDNPEMFLFCLANVLGLVINLLVRMEVAFYWVQVREGGRGDFAAKYISKTDIIYISVALVLTSAAAVYAAVVYYGGSSSGGDQDNVAIWILLVSWVSRPMIQKFTYICRGQKAGTDFKKYTVPMNIEFVIHRYGEWTMLMLGESILSLVIVDDISASEESDYYLTFYFGLISVILLQFVHFKSSPQHAEQHAMRRSRNAAFVYNCLVQAYSASLIIVGVSYKMLLTEYTSKYSYEYDSSGRELAGADDSSSEKLSTDDRRLRIAYFFCGGLLGTFAFLDWMNVAHVGIHASYEKSQCPTRKKWRVKGLVLVVFSRICIAVCLVVLSLYIYHYPKYIALLGLVSVALHVWIRFLGKVYFPSNIHTESSHDHQDKHICTESENLQRASLVL